MLRLFRSRTVCQVLSGWSTEILSGWVPDATSIRGSSTGTVSRSHASVRRCLNRLRIVYRRNFAHRIREWLCQRRRDVFVQTRVLIKATLIELLDLLEKRVLIGF